MASNKIIVSLMLISLISFVAAGCSDDDPVAAPPAVDTAPPAAPVQMAGDYYPTFDAVVVSWAENTVDDDLAGYVLTREHDGQSVDLIADPVLVQSFQDAGAPEGLNLYNVYAVDTSGNESAITSIEVYISDANRNVDGVRQQ